MKKLSKYFTKTDIIIWSLSVFLIISSFLIFDRKNFLTLTASLLGVTSLIFNAKGNPTGLVLMIVFSLFYGWISYTFAYYGEMITYLLMTLPMSAFALISWLRHPFNGNKAQVRVDTLNKRHITEIILLSSGITFVFYYILAFFNTSNLIPSTLSVTTSFAAVYLTFRRSPYYALAYAANDIVLIILWILASLEDTEYISVVACFAAFLINDIYGFVSWKRMEKKQTSI